ncbi:MAG TPA: hypothetical protein VLH19_02505 [Patescibacteria group bacterium]|nr:hypothetical protein [Patescibacteria group bacterium]
MKEILNEANVGKIISGLRRGEKADSIGWVRVGDTYEKGSNGTSKIIVTEMPFTGIRVQYFAMLGNPCTVSFVIDTFGQILSIDDYSRQMNEYHAMSIKELVQWIAVLALSLGSDQDYGND